MPIGGALLLTALVLDGTLVAEAREEVELARFAAPDSVGVDRAWQAYTRRRNATLTAGALGVAVGIAGAVLFLGSDAPQETSSLGVTSWVGTGPGGPWVALAAAQLTGGLWSEALKSGWEG